jgi:hypothetical protein
VLAGQLAFPAIPLHASDEAATSRRLLPRVPAPATPLSTRHSPIESALSNPLLDTLTGFGDLPEGFAIPVSDPTLDADPFFLRAQHWEAASGEDPPSPAATGDESPQMAFSTDEHGFSLRFREMARQWRVDAALHPVYFTGDFIVLAANDESLFRGCPGGEGVFVVRYEEMLGAQADGERVPIYFLPLPDTHWAGQVRALGFPAQGTVVLVDAAGEGLPVSEEDIETVLTVAKINLNMALGTGARAAVLNAVTLHSGGDVLPPPGSTAGFGTLFTGYDREHPENSVFRSLRVAWWERLGRDLGGLMESTARAETAEDSWEKIVHNLLWVSAVSGVALIAAVVLKYTMYRQYFRERHAGEGPPQGVLGTVGREGTDVGDVFAHNLAVLSQFSKVWFGRGVKFAVDRLFPDLNASNNNLIKRFLDWSVYYTGEASARVPVNQKTLIKQFVIMGGIDVASYDVQLYYTVPWLSERLTDWVPDLRSREESAFSASSDETAFYNRNETIETLTSYLTNPTFAAAQKDYYSSVLIPEVERELTAQGYEAGTAEYEKARQALLTQKVDFRLQQDGLPGSKDFLFDAATIWSFITRKILGYNPGDEADQKETFSGTSRPGLLVPAVKAARREAHRRLQQFPGDPALQSAAAILDQTARDVSYLGSFARYPLAVILEGLRGRGPPPLAPIAQAVRRVRQNLVALTYDGPVDSELRHIPNPWLSAFGEPGATVASELFRRSFFGFSSGSPTLLSGPPEAERAKLPDREGEVAKAARDRLADRYDGELAALLGTAGSDRDKALAQLERNHPGELALLRDGEWTRVVDAVTDAQTRYTPPKMGWYRQRQERRAKLQAQQEFLRRHGRAFDPSGSTSQDRGDWNAIYGEAMMREVGLYPDYDAEPGLRQRVDSIAHLSLTHQFSNPKFKEYLESLTDEERVDIAATLYAEHTTRAYIDVTVNSGLVPATSPAQPGRFQWLRQTAFVRKSGTLTRMIRSVESFFPEESHRAGLGAAIFRNTPGLYDLYIGNQRSYRNAVTATLAVYPVNLMLWGIGLPGPMFALSIVTGFFVNTPAAMLNRFFHMQGLQPMSSMRNLAFYTLIYSWATFGGAIPTLLFAGDFAKLMSAIGTVATTGLTGLGIIAGSGIAARLICSGLFKVLGK